MGDSKFEILASSAHQVLGVSCIQEKGTLIYIHVKNTFKALPIVNLKVLCLLLSKAFIGDQVKAYSKLIVLKFLQYNSNFSSTGPKSSGEYLKLWTRC